MDNSIFKSYDIRGIYPDELNEKDAFKIGQAFATYTGAKNVVVGRDGRISSPVLLSYLMEGLSSRGCNVYTIGETPTEGMYFATVNFDYDAGIMITASHNPKEYNGFKMIKRKSKGDFEVVRGKNLAGLVNGEEIIKKADVLGKVEELDIWKEYISHIFSFVDKEKINPLRIAIDASNGMAGKIIAMIQDVLPVEIISLNFDINGNFPAHEPNPLLEESTKQIKKKVVENKCDFGVIFDGDADRVYLIDEKGSFVRADTAFLLLVKYFLKKYPGRAVAYNLICSKAVPDFIKKMGGIPVRTKVGYVNVSTALREKNGIVSGEISGHYSFKDNYYFDSGMIAFLVFLQVISESGKRVSEIIKEYNLYEISAEINFKINNKDELLEKIKGEYSDGKQDFLDGLTVEYEDWWFNVRPSNTEPLLRLTVEAETKEMLEEKKEEISSFIKKSA